MSNEVGKGVADEERRGLPMGPFVQLLVAYTLVQQHSNAMYTVSLKKLGRQQSAHINFVSTSFDIICCSR